MVGDKQNKRQRKKRYFLWLAIGASFLATSGIYIFYHNKKNSEIDPKWLSRVVDNNDGTRDYILVNSVRTGLEPKIWRLRLPNSLQITTFSMGQNTKPDIIHNYNAEEERWIFKPRKESYMRLDKVIWPTFESGPNISWPASKYTATRRNLARNDNQYLINIRIDSRNLLTKFTYSTIFKINNKCRAPQLKLKNIQLHGMVVCNAPHAGSIYIYDNSTVKNIDTFLTCPVEVLNRQLSKNATCSSSTVYYGWQLHMNLPAHVLERYASFLQEVLLELDKRTVQRDEVKVELDK